MTATPAPVAHEHHDRLLRQVDAMPAVGDLVGPRPSPSSDRASTRWPRSSPGRSCRTWRPPSRRSTRARADVPEPPLDDADAPRARGDPAARSRNSSACSCDSTPDPFSTGEAVALRRVMFRLYALLKVHLAEEELYLGIIEHGVSAEAAELLAAAMDHSGITAF